MAHFCVHLLFDYYFAFSTQIFLGCLCYLKAQSVVTPEARRRIKAKERKRSKQDTNVMSLDKPSVTPDEVLAYSQPTEGFLCSLAANTYGIEFFKFTIRDMETNRTLFDIERERDELPAPGSLSPEMEVACRSIRYQFPPSFLRHRTVGAKLVFGVGPQPVPNFRMIERHYFRNVLVKSFDFSFGFCIPNSTNSWEAIYDMPALNADWEAAIIQNPYETRSDSFYFVNNQLVMHNKAEYAYNAPEPAY